MGLPYHQVVRKNAGPEARAGQREGRPQGTTRAVRGPGQAAAGLSEKNEEGGESGIPQRRQSAGGNVLRTSVRKACGKNPRQTCRAEQEIGSAQTGDMGKKGESLDGRCVAPWLKYPTTPRINTFWRISFANPRRIEVWTVGLPLLKLSLVRQVSRARSLASMGLLDAGGPDLRRLPRTPGAALSNSAS